jgi:hypothetical protein
MQSGISRMPFHPADVVKHSFGSGRFLHSQFLVQLILGEVNKFPMVGKFLHIIIHRSDITSQQFINAAVSFVLHFQDGTNASISIFLLLCNFDHFDGPFLHDPMDRQ